jgi:hypothetical protein
VTVFLKITEEPTFFGPLFSSGCGCALLMTKMGLAIFWAIFSQTHLVTLMPLFNSRIFFENTRNQSTFELRRRKLLPARQKIETKFSATGSARWYIFKPKIPIWANFCRLL